MRILITGFVVFVIWCFISAWLYNDHLLPVLKKPVPVLQIPDKPANEADSLAKLKASAPKEILIYFEFNDVKFKPDPQTDNAVGEFQAWLGKYPGSKILVSGNTDIVGTPEYNYDLGMKRAVVAGKYLENKGIDPGRIITESQGEKNPAGSNITSDGRAKNRRTVITIKNQ
jgi:outer membrane protein OmpA-like peptidoglycan-associated protein